MGNRAKNVLLGEIYIINGKMMIFYFSHVQTFSPKSIKSNYMVYKNNGFADNITTLHMRVDIVIGQVAGCDISLT